MHECPDENTLALLLSEQGTGRRLWFEQHIEACHGCRWAALAMAETLPLQVTTGERPPAADPGAPGDHEGRFALRRVLGRGGFGTVYEALDEATGELVALKIIHESGPAARRALREARGLAAMDHPRIVKAREAFLTVDGRTALVTELLDGLDLAAHLTASGPLDEPSARRLLAQAASALAYAHARGVVHRDLTPRNLFLQGSGALKILDFGMARWLDRLGVTSKLTRSGMVLGTPNYMSPEQISGEPDVGPPSDLWSLGVVLVEAMSGRRPVEGKSFGQLFRAVTAGAFPRLAEAAPHASPGLVALVDAMLCLDPAARVDAPGVLAALGPGADLFLAFRCDSSGPGASSGVNAKQPLLPRPPMPTPSSPRFFLSLVSLLAALGGPWLAAPALAQTAGPAKNPKAAPAKGAKGTKPPADPTPPAPAASSAPAAPAASSAPAAPPPEAPATPEATPPEPGPKKASGWVFDGNLGVPKLKSNETSLAFDVNVGWVGRSWGLGAYASSYTYALQQDGTLNQTQKMRFGFEVRYLSATPAADVRYEAKLEANSGAFNTTYIATAGSGGFSTEQSTLNRFTFMAGRRARVSETLFYKLELGLGLQTDTYFRASDGQGTGDTNFSASSSARFAGRARVSHRTIPDTLALRGELDASSFQLRRVAFFAGGSQTDVGAFDVTEFRETDLGLRLFGDLEKLSFLGLMPGVFAGLDVFMVSGGGRDTSALVPIFGVGLLNVNPRD